ncbi:hypothetical protein GYB22_00270 [bacterium]|nr:hypothetical protein [bacterium]
MRHSLLLLAFFIVNLSYGQDSSFMFLDGHENDVTTVTYSPDGKYIVSGDWSGQVNFYVNDSSPSLYLNFADHDGPVTSVAFSRDSKNFITGGMDGQVNLYSVDDSSGMIMLDTSFLFTTGHISKVFYGLGLRMIFASDDQNVLHSWDLKKRKERQIKAEGPITTFTISVDRKHYIATKGSTDIVEYDIVGKETRRFSGHEGEITDLAVTLNRKYLISTSEDKTTRVWSLAKGDEERKFEDHTWTITGLTVDPFSKYVATCGLDGLVNIHEIESGNLVTSYKSPNGRCKSLSLSADLSHLIVAIQLSSTPQDDFGYGCDIWSTSLQPPKPPTLKQLKNRR